MTEISSTETPAMTEAQVQGGPEAQTQPRGFLGLFLERVVFGGQYRDMEREADFLKANWEELGAHFRAAAIFVAVTAGLKILYDWIQYFPDSAAIVSLAVYLPCVLLALYITFKLSANRPDRRIPWMIFLLSVLVAGSNLAMMAQGRMNWDFYLLLVSMHIVYFIVVLQNRFFLSLSSGMVLGGSFLLLGPSYLPTDHYLFSVAIVLVVLWLAIAQSVRVNQALRRRHEDKLEMERLGEQMQYELKEAAFAREVVENAAAENVSLMEQLALAEADAKEKSMFLEAVLDHIQVGITVYDKDGRLAGWNKTVKELLELPDEILEIGASRESMIRFNAARGEYGEGDPLQIANDKLAMIEANKDQGNFSYDRARPNGRIMHLVGRALPDGGVITSYTDVTDDRKQQEETMRMAHKDGLTGLSNRRAFDVELASAIRKAGERDSGVILALIDLDNFKPVNDTYGHPVGDEVLRRVAGVLTHSIRDSDLAVRLGGDEFAIIFKNVTDFELVQERCTKIVQDISDIKIEGADKMALGASLGLGSYPEQAVGAEDLVNTADAALYAAKESGKGRVFVSPN